MIDQSTPERLRDTLVRKDPRNRKTIKKLLLIDWQLCEKRRNERPARLARWVDLPYACCGDSVFIKRHYRPELTERKWRHV